MRQTYIVFLLVTLMAGFMLVREAQGWTSRANFNPLRPTEQNATVNENSAESGIQATNRISIPYGIASPLPLSSDGQNVVVTGHGGCTENEQVTVMVTITQSTTGASGTGQTEQTCTGEFQYWTAIVTASTSTSFEAGSAVACGLATTRSDGDVTDTFDWCRDLTLTDWYINLPLVTRQ